MLALKPRPAREVDRLRAAAAMSQHAARRLPAGVAVELTGDGCILLSANAGGRSTVAALAPCEAWRLGRGLLRYALTALVRGRAWRWR